MQSKLNHLKKAREILEAHFKQRADLEIFKALEEIEWVISEIEWELKDA